MFGYLSRMFLCVILASFSFFCTTLYADTPVQNDVIGEKNSYEETLQNNREQNSGSEMADSDTLEDTSSEKNENLKIESIIPVSKKEISIIFSEAIDIDSIRVTIQDQKQQTNIRVASYTEESDKKKVKIALEDALVSANGYAITVNTAQALSGKTFQAGIDAILSFVTPDVFPEEADVTPPLDAEKNPNAVLATEDLSSNTPTENTTSDTGATEDDTPSENNSLDTGTTGAISPETSEDIPEEANIPSAEVLPSTGMNILFFTPLVLILLIATFLLRKKKRA